MGEVNAWLQCKDYERLAWSPNSLIDRLQSDGENITSVQFCNSFVVESKETFIYTLCGLLCKLKHS